LPAAVKRLERVIAKVAISGRCWLLLDVSRWQAEIT